MAASINQTCVIYAFVLNFQVMPSESGKKLLSKFLFGIGDHIAFIRPLLLIPIWTPALLGFWAGGGSFSASELWLLILYTTFLGIGIYGINQIFDRESDVINNKNLPLALGYISKFVAWFITVAGFVGVLFIGLFMPIYIALVTVLAVLLGISYSAPRFRFKDRPIVSLILNCVGHGILIYIIGYLFGIASSEVYVFKWFFLLRSIPYGIAFVSVYLATTVLDVSGDRDVGKRTFSVVYGQRKALAIAVLGVFLSGVLGLIFHEPAIFLTAVITFHIYAGALADKEIDTKKVVRGNKAAVLALAVLTLFYIPTFFIPVFIAIVFAYVYNRKRLGVAYP